MPQLIIKAGPNINSTECFSYIEIMTSASFYKGDNSKQGIVFDLPEDHLAR